MIKININKFSYNYIEPIIHHAANQWVFRVLLEVIKVVAAKIFLNYLVKCLFNELGTQKASYRKIYANVVFAPLIEEIIFRFFILKAIHLIGYIASLPLLDLDDVEEDKVKQQEKRQEMIRVHLGAFIFAAAHLLNPHRDKIHALIQFSWSYLGGVTYGYLTERYDSLAPAILSHGLNNYVAILGITCPEISKTLIVLALVINRVVSYVLCFKGSSN